MLKFHFQQNIFHLKNLKSFRHLFSESFSIFFHASECENWKSFSPSIKFNLKQQKRTFKRFFQTLDSSRFIIFIHNYCFPLPIHLQYSTLKRFHGREPFYAIFLFTFSFLLSFESLMKFLCFSMHAVDDVVLYVKSILSSKCAGYEKNIF